MKAYLLPLGAGADRSLPAVMAALSCGAVREVPAISVFRVSLASLSPLAEGMAADLNACHHLLAGEDAFSFCRTVWSLSAWQPRLPERTDLAPDDESRLLLSALRGENQPLSWRTDPEAAEWALSVLLDALPEAERREDTDPALAPLLAFLRVLEKDLDAGEDVRLLLCCDLSDGSAAGLAMGLLRFLRARFGRFAPFIGLLGQVRPLGAGAGDDLLLVRSVLSVLRDRGLVCPAEGRDTQGADAFWLLGLPSGLMTSEDSGKLLDWASARVFGDVFGQERRPAPGLHTREMPGILTLQALDRESRPAAAFLRASCWCLSDLFPALRQYFDHPTLLRSLAPATRNGLFRRLFRDGKEPEHLAVLERTLRFLLLEILSLLRALPAPLREADSASALWQEAVKACGRAVTLGAEYDVSRREAEESGIDKVAPVHRASMSDTEEEELQRKLDGMASELTRLNADRASVFEKTGGFRARQALEDCLNRCLAAEQNAREKMASMPADDPEERYAVALQERRIRLLSAAVRRCEADLTEACRPENLSRPGRAASAPFAGEILDPVLAEQAFLMLTAEGEAAETAARALRDGLGGLLAGYPMNDGKMLLKNLLASVRQPDAASPLRGLMAGVFSVCAVEVSGLRFQSAGDLPALPLLPDLRGGEDRFFTLSAAPERLLAPASRDRTAERRGLLAFLLLRQYRRRAASEAELAFFPFDGSGSAFCRAFLDSRGAEKAVLVCLRRPDDADQRPRPLALLLPGVGLESARLSAADGDLFPPFVRWLDRETMRFRDPCVYLSEGDRQILTQQLTRLRAAMNTPGGHVFTDFLSDWHRDIMQAPRAGEKDDLLPLRLRVACGLFRLPMWKKDLQRESAFFESDQPGDPVCAAIAGRENFEPASPRVREEVTYAFRGMPIARESALRLLESPCLPEERTLLSSLGEECSILLHSSDDYHEALAEGIREMTSRYPAADPEALSLADQILAEAREPVSEAVTELTWPWDTLSASVLTILTECLGPDLASAALRPFSDRLALFPARGGEIIGDRMLSGLCLLRREPDRAPRGDAADETGPVFRSDAAGGAPQAGLFSAGAQAPAGADSPVPAGPSSETAVGEGFFPAQPPAVSPDAVLPPLSPDFARALCRSPRGQSLVTEGFLSFSPAEGGIRAVITLEGAFSLRLIRVYGPEEQVSLYAHDLPSLAVWPSLPFAPDQWRAYFSWAHAPEDFSFSVITPEEECVLEGVAPRFAVRTEGFPLCFLLSRGGSSLGALPNLLPPPDLPDAGSWTACLDFGSAASSVVLTDGTARWPMQGPVRVRTLLKNPVSTDTLLWREFLPSVPVSALLPGALRIYRNDLSDGDLPLRDAGIFLSASLRDVLEVSPQALYTDLKWNGEKGRAVGLYLHQLMLLASLEARCGGASALSWRAAVPDEMAPEGRERLARLFQDLAATVSRESGLPLPEKAPPVVFASESAALGAYFRFCAAEEARGGFMALDLGADTADLSLFLRGRDQAVRACQLPLGVHYMLLPAFLRRPGLLSEDFGFVENDAFHQDLLRLQELLARSARDPAALRQARYGVDALIADYCPLMFQALSLRRAQGAPGYTGALLLLHFSFLMMLSGLTLLQISVDSQKNDFLPSSMTLFLAGRGAGLMEALSPPVRTSLWKILTMFRNPRVSSLNLLFSAEKKMEIPVGLAVYPDPTAALPRAAQAPVSMAVRPEELMPEFLLRFRREFPGEAALLFPGLYAADFTAPFSPHGTELLAQSLQASFGDREAGRPYPALIACLSHLLDMIQEERGF